MKQIIKISILLIILSLTSCATLINSNSTEVNLYSKQDSVKVFSNDTSNYSYAPTKIKVERSKEPLILTIEKNSIKRKIIIPSKLTPEFWLGNILNGSLYIGYLVDLTNDKRFNYPTNVYCDINYPNQIDLKYKPIDKTTNSFNLLTKTQQKKKYSGEKGAINIKFSIPEGNSFVINKETYTGNSFGFLGITTGIDYYYKDKKYIGIGAGTLTDFISPIPAPFDVMGEYERSFGSYIDILQGFDINRFSFNYGLSFSRYTYYKRTTEELFPDYVDSLLNSKKENRIGLSISSKFKITKYFNIGVKYIPSIYTLKTNEFRYGHLLFFDIALNLEIRNKKRK